VDFRRTLQLQQLLLRRARRSLDTPDFGRNRAAGAVGEATGGPVGSKPNGAIGGGSGRLYHISS